MALDNAITELLEGSDQWHTLLSSANNHTMYTLRDLFEIALSSDYDFTAPTLEVPEHRDWLEEHYGIDPVDYSQWCDALMFYRQDPAIVGDVFRHILETLEDGPATPEYVRNMLTTLTDQDDLARFMAHLLELLKTNNEVYDDSQSPP